MTGWLAYSGAFGCAVAAGVMAYMAGFATLMGGAGYGIGGFIMLALLLPVGVALKTFGVTYYAFAGRSFNFRSWLNGIALACGATGVCFGMIVTDIVQERVAAILWLVVMFVGGAALLARATHD